MHTHNKEEDIVIRCAKLRSTFFFKNWREKKIRPINNIQN